jgi:hypothetical protein
MADYSEVPKLDSAIKSLLDDYFDVMFFQDMKKFDRVFHSASCLYSTQTGELNIRPYAIYRQAVLDRNSPSSLGESRNEKILHFDQISNTLALVRVQLTMFGGVMQDYLNIVYLDGQWWVMAKMWEKVAEHN